MNESKLDEFAAKAKNKKKLDEHDSFALKILPISKKLLIAKEYNTLKNPDLSQTLIISEIEIDRFASISNQKDAEELLKAYIKCARNLSNSKDEELDHNKYRLGCNIKQLVSKHPQYSAQAFAILSNYLTDVDVIEPIRFCVSCDNTLMDKGFAAIHKSADSICAKASDDKKATRQLNLAFADLYKFDKYSDSLAAIKKITSYFMEFEEQIDRNYCNLDRACCNATDTTKDQEFNKQMLILSKSFERWKRSCEPFKDIYAKETRRYEFINKVHKKIIAHTADQGLETTPGEYIWLLNHIYVGDDYLKFKRNGKTGNKYTITGNKILMQARREIKEETK